MMAGRESVRFQEEFGRSERPSAASLESINKAAFSLLELLMVVGILLLLTTLYWGGTSGNRRKNLEGACQANLEKMYMALQIYANDSAGKFPVATNARTAGQALDLLVPRYTVDTAIFICPGSKDPMLPESESLSNRVISYSYYMGRTPSNSEPLVTDHQVDTLSKSPGQSVFSSTGKPPGNNHVNSGNFLYCDGHMEAVPTIAKSPLIATNGVVLLNP